MLQIIRQPDRLLWADLCRRPVMSLDDVLQKVQPVMQDVKENGEAALMKYAAQFEKANLNDVYVSQEEFENAGAGLSSELKHSINQAAEHITKFHAAQLIAEPKVETMPGVICWRRSIGIERVGIYIPGGTAPLFSTVLMLAIPAKLAGCDEIVMCTPPQHDGSIAAAVLYAAGICGVKKVIKAGGAQAIAAMAYGLQHLQPVFKIFGPGNQYVTAAKQLVQTQGVAIDMPAGPSEVCVLADGSAEPAFVAADLLSQAEHGPDSQVMLVCTPDFELDVLNNQLQVQMQKLPRGGLVAKSLASSKAICFKAIDECIAFANAYAAEHLIIMTDHAEHHATKIRNAGSVFIGHHSPESVGDYASGTNHTLPTNGYARMYSGVSTDSFVKKVTFQQLTPSGLQRIASTVINMAEAEGLQAHAEAVRIRTDFYNNKKQAPDGSI